MRDGRLLFAHYALAPNRLGYCGGNDDQTLFDYCVEGEADNGIDPLIRQFQAACPYLKFISQANGITNPLDPKVVEAYWIGNRLLERVDMRGFYEFLQNLAGPRDEFQVRIRGLKLPDERVDAIVRFAFHAVIKKRLIVVSAAVAKPVRSKRVVREKQPTVPHLRPPV